MWKVDRSCLPTIRLIPETHNLLQLQTRKMAFPIPTFVFTLLAMLAFAGNSLLCRMALKHTAIDAASFTTIRLISGAAVLWLIVRLQGNTAGKAGNWRSALALLVYAASFSIAYVSLPAAVGALLLFGAVQITMISYGLWVGERLQRLQVMGLTIACTGLVGLLLPGLSAPPLQSALLMLLAGVAWGIYSLLGKGVKNPIRATETNFLRTVPFAIVLSPLTRHDVSWDSAGVGYAVLSGAVTSAGGYAIWYTVLPELKATQAAIVQLSVPILAAIGAIILLDEPMTLRLALSACAVLGGIALVIYQRREIKTSNYDRKINASNGRTPSHQ
jgi:drug/metabolite transporter (DMT)-like permease